MKRMVLFLVTMCAAHTVVAQVASGPAQPPTPQTVQVESDGKCKEARSGDTINFSLTIDSVATAKAVYGELQLREGRSGGTVSSRLPAPDFRNLAGGGQGVRDAQTSNLYHFAFKVPAGILGGVYHGVGVLVTVDKPALNGEGRTADVTRKTRDEVRAYCLVVMGTGNGEGRPEVTSFTPGAVERPVAKP